MNHFQITDPSVCKLEVQYKKKIDKENCKLQIYMILKQHKKTIDETDCHAINQILACTSILNALSCGACAHLENIMVMKNIRKQ